MFGHSVSAGMHWTPVQLKIQAPGPIASTT
jgi:hypothetical protein